MNKKVLLLGSSLVLLLFAGAIFYRAYFVDKRDDKISQLETKEEVDKPLSSYVSGSSPESNTAESQSNNVLSLNQSLNSVTPLDTRTPAERANNQSNSTLPSPQEFDQYDEYIDAENALYVDIVEGDGETVRPGDNLAVVYSGWLTNGQLFDQSQKNEQGLYEPFVFSLGSGQVIRGWEEGLVGMSKGGKRRIVVPPAAGYGQTGQGQIPPNSVLVFDVQLVDFAKSQ